MKHLGNISKINVAEAEAVDVVIGGSPCQDLSIAGKRAGLDGARSGLFMEQIRICREMRERDRAAGRAGIDVRPRFCVWENVPGALSSNDGEDFRIVLEEFCKVADPSATVPRPPKGKWKSAGCIVGDGYSVAWRIMDARYYGVPQRRHRISLVADFAGGCAPQILFDEQGMCWNLETSQKAWQGITGHAAGSVGGSGCDWGCKCLNPEDPQSYRLFETSGAYQTLYAGEKSDGQYTGVCYSIEGNTVDRESNKNGKGFSVDVSTTLNVQDKHAVVYDARGNGDGKTVCTVTGDHCDRITDYTPLVLGTGQGGAEVGKDESPCLNCNHEQPIAAYGGIPPRKYIIRRLTPLECSRLQGLPDDFADVPAYEDVSDGELDFWREVWAEWAEINGKKPKTDKQIRKWLQAPISESNQYQIYGNGIALPQWVWVLGRISEKLGKEHPTMASLFDGSGSFPLIWEAINGKGTAVWSSEVNPEAIRVSRYRIGGDASC